MGTLLELRHCFVLPTDARPQLLKDAFLPCLPVAASTVLKHTVKLLLRLTPSLLDRRYEILLVRVAQVASHIRVLEGLEWRECRLRVQVRDRIRERGRIYVCLRKEVVSTPKYAFRSASPSRRRERYTHARLGSADVPGCLDTSLRDCASI